MIEEKRTFKFPDGEGGWILKVQLPDGSWEPCDEEGNLLEPSVKKPEQPQAEGSARKKKPAARRSKKASSVPLRGERERANNSLHFYASDRLSRLITEYLVWCTIKYRRPVTRSEVIARIVEVYIDKDSEFQEFLKKEKED